MISTPTYFVIFLVISTSLFRFLSWQSCQKNCANCILALGFLFLVSFLLGICIYLRILKKISFKWLILLKKNLARQFWCDWIETAPNGQKWVGSKNKTYFSVGRYTSKLHKKVSRQYLAHNMSSNEMYISFEFIILEHLSIKRNWDSANMLRKIIFHYIFISKFLGPSIRCIALFFGPLIKLENL